MSDQIFIELFGSAPDRFVFTPGRVNIIGEHTDYNGGMVLPMALPIGIKVYLRYRTDNNINISSDRFDKVISTSLDDPIRSDWADYAIGALIYAHKEGIIQSGVDILITSELPYGSGLSSSAAVIVGVLKAARSPDASGPDDTEIALLARKIENEYLSVPCGIMDQMAVSVAKSGSAMALDTRTLDYDIVAVPDDYHFAIVHSGSYRTLTDGRYAERKTECDQAKSFLSTPDLCLLTDVELAKAQELSDTVFRRVRHCVTEHRRTLQAHQALKLQDISALGQHMTESHRSLRDDFEVSLPEIDHLVEDAIRFGAAGARLTGAGFGGCIIALVSCEKLQDWCTRLTAAHPDAYFVC